MHKIYPYFLAISLILTSSCNSLKDLAVIGIPMEFERTFDVVANNTVGLSYQANDTIDFTENADVAANLDNINRYEIKSITYVVTNVVSDADAPLLVNGKITLSSFDDETISIATILENIDLKEIQENTSEIEEILPFTAEDFELLSEILASGNKVKLSYEANMDTVVNFSIAVTLDVSLKIGI